MHACESGGRARRTSSLCCASAVTFFFNGGRGVGLSVDLQSAAPRLVYTQVGRKGDLAVLLFYLSFCRSVFPERGESGRVYGGYLPSAAALLISMTVGREGDRAVFFFFFWASTIRIPRCGGRGMVFSSDLYNRR